MTYLARPSATDIHVYTPTSLGRVSECNTQNLARAYFFCRLVCADDEAAAGWEDLLRACSGVGRIWHVSQLERRTLGSAAWMGVTPYLAAPVACRLHGVAPPGNACDRYLP